MYGLPQDFEPHSLEGYALVMIGLGTGTLVLNFSRSLPEQSSAEMRISIGSEFEYLADGVGGTETYASADKTYRHPDDAGSDPRGFQREYWFPKIIKFGLFVWLLYIFGKLGLRKLGWI